MFCTLLNQHSQIALLYEADLPSLERYLWGRFRGGSWREKWEFWNQAPSRHGITLEYTPGQISTVWQATRIAYQSVADRKKAIIWGEKTHNCQTALRLAANFPDAAFIFLWRDSQSVMENIAMAAQTEHYFRKSAFTQRVMLGTEELRRVCDELKFQGRSVHQVYYEDLVENTTESMQQVCNFLRIPYEPQMATLEGADRSAIEGRECEHHASVWRDRVVPQRRHPELTSPALQRKIDRYVSRWKQQYDGNWPKYPVEVPKDTQPPGAIELCYDRVTYQYLMYWDALVKLIYALVPVSLARSLRGWLRQRSDAAVSRRLYEPMNRPARIDKAQEAFETTD